MNLLTVHKMKVQEWLHFFKKYEDIKLFHISFLKQYVGESKTSFYKQLYLLVERGIVTRVSRGWYENPFNSPSIEEIAMKLRYPAYISMESLLSDKNILSQGIQKLTLVNLKRPYTFTVKNYLLEYHQLRKDLFWFGYENVNGVRKAFPEKALLDFLYIQYTKKGNKRETIFSYMDDMYFEMFNISRLKKYMRKYPPSVEQIFHEFHHKNEQRIVS